MKDFQEIAMDRKKMDFIKKLESTCELFIQYPQQRSVISTGEVEMVDARCKTSKAKLNYLFEILKNKGNSWSVILNYLEENNYAELAKQLRTCAEEEKALLSEPNSRNGNNSCCENLSTETLD